ncbi:hypothetical protein L484_000555 [Morus notabilis]|uniref:Uncharacterized protein n=1 Tax=Morus notabilis TaxID=981085 RepID=W9R6D1_9ROSA|nr:hypothetical protein L484_004185 [Morus notabilis]EXB55599.1 hypothetical protein L484_000555 [Morus notabilis]
MDKFLSSFCTLAKIGVSESLKGSSAGGLREVIANFSIARSQTKSYCNKQNDTKGRLQANLKKAKEKRTKVE